VNEGLGGDFGFNLAFFFFTCHHKTSGLQATGLGTGSRFEGKEPLMLQWSSLIPAHLRPHLCPHNWSHISD